jgi:hypothetical protein
MIVLNQFKSWHLALISILLQFLIGLYTLNNAIAAKGFEGFVGVVASSAFLFFSALGVIPLLLLVFQKTKKIGGLISILVGVFGIVTQFGIISGIFLIIAGILALWKKI